MDIFFCSIPGVRDETTEICLAAWGGRPLFHLTPKLLGVSNAEFQKARRTHADEHSDGPYYIVADDDCMPYMERVDLSLIESTMDMYPEFAILSMWPDNAIIQKWTPEDYVPYADSMVEEHVSVGGIRVCRKGLLKDWPELVGNAYDMAQCEAVRASGKRVGYFKNLKMIHLGEGRTTLQ